MPSPEVLIDLEKIRRNTRNIVDFCRSKGISVTGVTKVSCGMPSVGKAMLEGGVIGLGESRMENIRRLRRSGINAPLMMLRIPPLSQVEEIVAHTDISLNSELPVIQSLSEAAIKQGKIHKILLMVDLGDLREGIWPSDLLEITREVTDLEGVKIIGIGTNLTCFGGVLPSRKNMAELVAYARKIEEAFPLKLEMISGGNSSSLPLLMEGGMPQGINHLRIGEAILLGKETVNGTIWPGCRGDAFQLAAEVIEVKRKPSVPLGETGQDAFGGKPLFSRKGDIRRAILNVGREDVVVDHLFPEDGNISILGASSDHLLLDVTGAEKTPELGDKILFNMNYGALLAAMTSGYVAKVPLTGKREMAKPVKIILTGDSPLYQEENLLHHLNGMGLDFAVSHEEISDESVGKILKEDEFPFIGGAVNKTTESLKALIRVFDQIGLIVFSPSPALLPPEKADLNHSYLSNVLGFPLEKGQESSRISPENIVIIGLRTAENSEGEIIKKKGILVYTMEDIDLMGMREIMINSLRKATTGTEGFYTRLSTDVIKAEGEGLTFREAHLAMEMMADTKRMLAFDISGTPDKSWIDDKSLGGIVESAFGKRILP